jgi:hypothetical protein
MMNMLLNMVMKNITKAQEGTIRVADKAISRKVAEMITRRKEDNSMYRNNHQGSMNNNDMMKVEEIADMDLNMLRRMLHNSKFRNSQQGIMKPSLTSSLERK